MNEKWMYFMRGFMLGVVVIAFVADVAMQYSLEPKIKAAEASLAQAQAACRGAVPPPETPAESKLQTELIACRAGQQADHDAAMQMLRMQQADFEANGRTATVLYEEGISWSSIANQKQPKALTVSVFGVPLSISLPSAAQPQDANQGSTALYPRWVIPGRVNPLPIKLPGLAVRTDYQWVSAEAQQ